MTELFPSEEAQVRSFSQQLATVHTVEDLFPPEDGVREPRRPRPYMPTMAAALAIQAVQLAGENCYA